MIIGLIEIVDFIVSLSFEIWVNIQGYGGVVMVVLKVESEDLELDTIHKHKGFVFNEAWLLCR